MNNYDDIINLPHYQSKKHKRMSLRDRAAQFAPFAALTGHDSAISETARLTDCKAELDETKIEEINRTLNKIKKKVKRFPNVTITYFVPDKKKDGGMYVTVDATVKKIDEAEKKIILAGGQQVDFNNIFDLTEKATD